MKRTAFLLPLAVTLICGFSIATYKLYPDDRPVEFLQSLVIGPKNITLQIPGAYHMVKHDLGNRQHQLSFVRDDESIDNWSQFVSLNIINNTSESAAMRMGRLKTYLKQHYQNVDVIESSINRSQAGIQNAIMNVSYTDDQSDIVISAHYFSDSASLIGVEVSQRIKRNISSAKNSAERIANNIVHLSNT